MADYQTVKARIADDLNRSDIGTQIGVAINRAVRHYAKEPLWFTETTSTFTLSAGAKTYTSTDSNIPSTIGDIRYVEVTVNGSDYELEKKDVAWIEANNPQDTQGNPAVYAWWENKFWVGPVPNGAHVVKVYHRASYATLSASADTNNWLAYGEDVIEARARGWINRRVLHNYPAAADDKAEELEALQGLRERHEAIAGDTPVEPTDF